MTKTNSLTSHFPERNSHRVDKMSGMTTEIKRHFIGKSKRFEKRFTNKKRRQFLKKLKDEE